MEDTYRRHITLNLGRQLVRQLQEIKPPDITLHRYIVELLRERAKEQDANLRLGS